MQNRAELERATQKFHQELEKSTHDLQAKTTELAEAEKNIPILKREILDLEAKINEKKLLLQKDTQRIQLLKSEIPRLSIEMKKRHEDLENFTRTQAEALKSSGVAGIRHKF